MEASVFEFIVKYLWMPILALLGWLGKKTFASFEERIAKSEKKVDALQQNLAKNYFDKEELKEHIVAPLEESLMETRSELKELTGTVNQIHHDIGILKFAILGKETDK